MLNNIVVLFGGVLFSAYSLWLAWKASKVYDKMDELISLSQKLNNNMVGIANNLGDVRNAIITKTKKEEGGCGEGCQCH